MKEHKLVTKISSEMYSQILDIVQDTSMFYTGVTEFTIDALRDKIHKLIGSVK